MKKNAFALLISLAIISCCKKPDIQMNKWEVLDVKYSGILNDINVLAEDTLMLLSTYDETYEKTCIFESDDAGANWSQKCFNKLTPSGFYNFYCLNHKNIFAQNFRSYDGGNSWQIISNFGGGWVHFFDNQVGIGISGFDIYKTLDAGKTFSLVYDSTSYILCRFVQFINNQTGYASGGNAFDTYNAGLIVKTTDGGNTWKVLPGQFKSIIGMSFITADLGYLLVDLHQGDVLGTSISGAELLKTTDGGQTWKSINNKIGDFNIIPLQCIFIDEAHGFIGGTGKVCKIYSTNDSGKTWTEEYENSSTSVTLTKMILTSSKKIYAIGTNGLLLKRDII